MSCLKKEYNFSKREQDKFYRPNAEFNMQVCLKEDRAEYNKTAESRTDLVSFFKNSPLANVEIELARSKDSSRDINISL